MNLKQIIDEIIDKTFDRLQYSYKHLKEGQNSAIATEKPKTRIVFPKYSDTQDGKTRVSEQELRLAFIEEFNEYCNKNNLHLFYSIETPTRFKYKFQGEHPKVDDTGKSARFDVVIHNENLERVCLMEFKAKNAAKFDHEKDFEKLKNEYNDNLLTYFVEVLESYDNGTIKSLKVKIDSKDRKTVFRCYSLNEMEEISEKI